MKRMKKKKQLPSIDKFYFIYKEKESRNIFCETRARVSFQRPSWLIVIGAILSRSKVSFIILIIIIGPSKHGR